MVEFAFTFTISHTLSRWVCSVKQKHTRELRKKNRADFINKSKKKKYTFKEEKENKIVGRNFSQTSF